VPAGAWKAPWNYLGLEKWLENDEDNGDEIFWKWI
jgi:hypothetical protein